MAPSTRCQVRFAPEAADQLTALRQFISTAATPTVADGYIEAIAAHCEKLSLFPQAATRRDDLRPGLRTTAYKKRVIIAFTVNDSAQTVTVLGIYYGGQDFHTLLSGDPQP